MQHCLRLEGNSTKKQVHRRIREILSFNINFFLKIINEEEEAKAHLPRYLVGVWQKQVSRKRLSRDTTSSCELPV